MPGDVDILNKKDIDLILIDLEIADLMVEANTNKLADKARITVETLLKEIKEKNIQITAPDLLEQIKNIKRRFLLKTTDFETGKKFR